MTISKSILGAALGLALPSAAFAAEPAPNLCEAKETPVLACKVTGSGKLASLCLGPSKLLSKGLLKYRFGTKEKIELTFPKDDGAAKKNFKRTHSVGAASADDGVSFTNEGVTYDINQRDAPREDGLTLAITVTKEGKTIATLKCDATSVFEPDKLDPALKAE